MIIQAELNDGHIIKVCQVALDRLLERKMVKRFLRSSGWAIIGVHPIRASKDIFNIYSGHERRHVQH